MNGLELAVAVLILVLGLASLGGAIAPRPYCALLRRWYEFWGVRYDALIQSERRNLMAMRFTCAVAFVTMVGLAALMIYVLSQFGAGK
jgi:hypothetical protein